MNGRFLFIALTAGLVFSGRWGRADEAVVPGQGFTASRYEALWTKSPFAVASPGGMGHTSRSVGFLVDDLEVAAAGLREAGVEVGPIGDNERERYLHFRAPDRELYELVERKVDTP